MHIQVHKNHQMSRFHRNYSTCADANSLNPSNRARRSYKPFCGYNTRGLINFDHSLNSPRRAFSMTYLFELAGLRRRRRSIRPLHGQRLQAGLRSPFPPKGTVSLFEHGGKSPSAFCWIRGCRVIKISVNLRLENWVPGGRHTKSRVRVR